MLAVPGGVLADAALVASTPASGETLTATPPEAILEFDHSLTSASSFVILDDAGTTVVTGEPNPSEPMVMRAPLPALAPGLYHVRWTAGSDDGHIVRGAFEFSVEAPPTPTPAPTESPTDAPIETTAPPPTAAPAPTPTAAPTGDGGDSGAGGDVLIPILAVGILVVGGLVVMLRRRGAA